MKLNEFDNYLGAAMPRGMYDPEEDKVSSADLDDTRKKRVTLKDLNRLKKLRAFRKLQNLKRQDTLAIIYGKGEDSDSGGF